MRSAMAGCASAPASSRGMRQPLPAWRMPGAQLGTTAPRAEAYTACRIIAETGMVICAAR